MFESESDRDVWQLALIASTQGSVRNSPTLTRRRASDVGQSGALTADKFRLSTADASAKGSLLEPIAPAYQLSETRRKETVEWLNPLIARFWQNIRVNPAVAAALKDKLSKKLMQKVNEKKLTGYLVRCSSFLRHAYAIRPTLRWTRWTSATPSLCCRAQSYSSLGSQARLALIYLLSSAAKCARASAP